MTPFETAQLDQQQIERQDTIKRSLYLDGSTDAAFGESPSSKDPIYLDGYLGRLRELILNSPNKLQIRWLSDAYLSQGYDAPEEF